MRLCLDLYNKSAQRVNVYPSAVELQFPDGDSVWIDVGNFYALFAAHLHQNGAWGSVNWLDLPESVRSHFAMEQYRWDPKRYKLTEEE